MLFSEIKLIEIERGAEGQKRTWQYLELVKMENGVQLFMWRLK